MGSMRHDVRAPRSDFTLAAIVLISVVVVVGSWSVGAGHEATTAHAGERTPALASASTSIGPPGLGVNRQEDGTDGGTASEDDRVPVQVWTILAAGGAAAVGLVLYVVRLALGWVKPPPPPSDESH